jgi:hypothetical protein
MTEMDGLAKTPELVDVCYEMLEKSFAFETGNYRECHADKELIAKVEAAKRIGGDKNDANSSVNKAKFNPPSRNADKSKQLANTQKGQEGARAPLEFADFEAHPAALKWLDACIRLFTVLLTKHKPFEHKFIQEHENQIAKQKSSSGKSKSKQKSSEKSSALAAKATLVQNLVRIVCVMRPQEYLRDGSRKNKDLRETMSDTQISNMRGNLALLFAHIVNLEVETAKYGDGGSSSAANDAANAKKLMLENGSAEKNKSSRLKLKV